MVCPVHVAEKTIYTFLERRAGFRLLGSSLYQEFLIPAITIDFAVRRDPQLRMESAWLGGVFPAITNIITGTSKPLLTADSVARVTVISEDWATTNSERHTLLRQISNYSAKLSSSSGWITTAVQPRKRALQRLLPLPPTAYRARKGQTLPSHSTHPWGNPYHHTYPGKGGEGNFVLCC